MKYALIFLFLIGCESVNPNENKRCEDCLDSNSKEIMHGWKFESDDHSKYRLRPKSQRKTGDVVKGKLLFEKHCVKCHGNSGTGDGPLAKEMEKKPSDLTANNWFHKRHFFFMASEGSAGMPAWKSVLSEEDLRNIIAYIQAL